MKAIAIVFISLLFCIGMNILIRNRIEKNLKDSVIDLNLKYQELKDQDDQLIVMSWKDVCFVKEVE